MKHIIINTLVFVLTFSVTVPIKTEAYFVEPKIEKTSTVASATIDLNSLNISSSKPTITGTAKGTKQITITIANKAEGIWTSDLIPVIDGKWSVSVSIPDFDLLEAVKNKFKLYVLVNTYTPGIGAIGTLNASPKLSTSKIKLGKLFVTPNGLPTIKIPQGWTAIVHKDIESILSLSTTTISRSIITFLDDSNANRGLLFQMFSARYSVDTILEALGLPNVTPDEILSYNKYGLKITELQFKHRTSNEMEIIRIFSIAGDFYVVTGISSNILEKYSDFETWYKQLFDSIVIESLLNKYEGGVSIKKTAKLEAEYLKLNKKIDATRKIPQGTPSDLNLSTCYKISKENMAFGGNDYIHNGQVSMLQKMLFEKYKVTSGNITGVFDDLTLIQTIRFQREMGLEGSGIVGPKTIELLNLCKQK